MSTLIVTNGFGCEQDTDMDIRYIMCLKTSGHIYPQMLNLVSQQQPFLATLDFLQLPGRRIDADFVELLMRF